MLSLLLESCTERSLVAIVEDGHFLYFAGLPFGLHHSRYLVPKIDEGFQSIGKNPKDLDFIAVGVGPGSYTGIRVGATIGKTLSFSTKVPLIGISSLEGFIPQTDGHFLAMIDAKMAGTYVMKGRRENEEIIYLSGPQVIAIEDLKPILAESEILVGPSFQTLRAKIEALYPNLEFHWEETAPDPIHLAQRATKKFEKKEYSLDGSLELLYLSH